MICCPICNSKKEIAVNFFIHLKKRHKFNTIQIIIFMERHFGPTYFIKKKEVLLKEIESSIFAKITKVNGICSSEIGALVKNEIEINKIRSKEIFSTLKVAHSLQLLEKLLDIDEKLDAIISLTTKKKSIKMAPISEENNQFCSVPNWNETDDW